MNCPYCHRAINAWTGFQEAVKLQKHLRTCRKNPANLPITDGKKTIISKSAPTLAHALKVRADSGQ